MRKVAMLINDTTYAYNLRGALINRLVTEGYEVLVVCQVLEHKDDLVRLGAEVIGVSTNRHGTNPINDIKLLFAYRSILKKIKPDIVLTYNIKPNSYGGMACRMLKIPYISNVTGLGKPLENPGRLQKLAIWLYKAGVSAAACVMFQNEDNRRFFQAHGMLQSKTRTKVIPGSGVDLDRFPLLPWNEREVHFLFAARIMKEKGIDMFLAAAREFTAAGFVFDVCGQCDDEKYRKILENEKAIHYHGLQKDMTPFYEQCSCFVYPSNYPEGMSNVLLEAAASGRPVIATDRPGCRETLENGKTGFLVPVNNEASVIEAVRQFINLTPDERKKMGLEGRRKAEKEFDRKIVVDIYLEEMKRCLANA